MPRSGISAAAAVAVLLGPVPAAYALPGPPVDPHPVQPVAATPETPVGPPPKVAEELDVFRGNAADAALGNPVAYGDGQCYPLIQEYIRALGYGWRNRDPSGNAFDLYHHYPTNGLGQYFDQIPFDGGASVPQVGDIVVYGPGGFVSEHGHAAVVTDVRGSAGLFRYEVAEQNSGGRLFVTLNWRDSSPMWNTLGYLRPRP